jgi:hypothetical protein
MIREGTLRDAKEEKLKWAPAGSIFTAFSRGFAGNLLPPFLRVP